MSPPLGFLAVGTGVVEKCNECALESLFHVEHFLHD